MNDRTDRNKRFARNLALSLAGGAVLTVIGAGAAHADEAGTASDGAGTTGTGDATAVGNKSGTQTGQTLAPSGGGGSPQIITQTAVVPNVGVAIANTGGNVAIGNQSNNTSSATQTATGGGIASSNSGDVANASNGSAWITTGDASAVGNESTTAINQGHEGAGVSGLLVVDQDALVVNAGIAVANTGINGAVGNDSNNTAGLLQDATNPLGIATNTASVATGSNGRGSVSTGDAAAVGNTSRTEVAQGGGPGDGATGGLVIIDQNALVANAGLGLANTGGNLAAGNISTSTTGPGGAGQFAINTIAPGSLVLGSLASNAADISLDSDGDASIQTGDADATGNDSNTNVTQAAHGEPTALGGIVTTQNAGILNLGLGVANTGINGAVGNASPANTVGVGVPQNANNVGAFTTGLLAASNSLSASASSDGTAEIVTGDASATGNDSDTNVDQTADGSVTAGMAVNAQVTGVLNAGAGIANSGGNLAVGNVSSSIAGPGSQFAGLVANPPGVIAPVVTSSNTADASTASDGTARIHTGDATAIGNTSGTNLTQHADAEVDGAGAVVNVQAAGVANVGLGIANSGINAAVGNTSSSNATANQVNAPVAGGSLVTGPVTTANTARASSASDGTGTVDTGDTWARGNYSETTLDQAATGTIPEGGMGVVPNIQAAGVLNAGVGAANSGLNAAVGNASGVIGSPNVAVANQVATFVGFGQGILGPVTSTNTADASNASDGTAKVHTGDASASGNWSVTQLSQDLDVDVDGGVVVAPQLAAVVNVGAGVANSGVNAAVGNLSTNVAIVGFSGVGQRADFLGIVPSIIAGPVTVGNTADMSNSSDGEACACTGDASASGNISRSTLSQELDATVEGGVSVAPQTGLIVNAGFGLANSGVNLAIGNVSNNTALTDQEATFVPPLAPGPLPAQTITNNGGAANASKGTGKVGTGNASAIGNLSESDLAQAAAIDGPGVIAPMNSTIGNVGLGLANAGVNLGVGNASTNTAILDQTASGQGLVANTGTAANESDGTGQIGDPDCEDEVTTPGGPKAPGAPSLPRTGNELETEAALALMLLLAGFGLRKGAKHLA